MEDLGKSVKSYQSVLGLGEFTFEALPERGVETARIQLGPSWIVLVSPTRKDSVPARFLEENGEGFFLLSLGVKSLEAALDEYERSGGGHKRPDVREGLMGWRVSDLDTVHSLGAMFHFTEDASLS